MPYKKKKDKAAQMRNWRKKQKTQMERALDALWKLSPTEYVEIFGEPRRQPRRRNKK